MLDTLARARENGGTEEEPSKRLLHWYPAHAAPVEVLADLPEPRRISEQ